MSPRKKASSPDPLNAVYCKRARDKKREVAEQHAQHCEVLEQHARSVLGSAQVEIVLNLAHVLADALFSSPAVIEEEEAAGGAKKHSRRSRRRANINLVATSLHTPLLQQLLDLLAQCVAAPTVADLFARVHLQSAWNEMVTFVCKASPITGRELPTRLQSRILENTHDVLQVLTQDPASLLALMPFADMDELSPSAQELLRLVGAAQGPVAAARAFDWLGLDDAAAAEDRMAADLDLLELAGSACGSPSDGAVPSPHSSLPGTFEGMYLPDIMHTAGAEVPVAAAAAAYAEVPHSDWPGFGDMASHACADDRCASESPSNDAAPSPAVLLSGALEEMYLPDTPTAAAAAGAGGAELPMVFDPDLTIDAVLTPEEIAALLGVPF